LFINGVFSTIYCNSFSALALIILFSVLPNLKKKADLDVEKLEYSEKVAGFEPTPSSLNHVTFN